jgi:hypothetical protein
MTTVLRCERVPAARADGRLPAGEKSEQPQRKEADGDCDLPRCKPTLPGELVALGTRNLSHVLFSFANRVVELSNL